MTNENGKAHLEAYIRDQYLAELMIPSVGQLYREQGVIVTVFGRKLMNASVIDIIKAHRFGRNMVGQQPALEQTSAVLEAMKKMNLGASRIDIGRLAYSYSVDEGQSIEGFLDQELASVNTGDCNLLPQPQDVVLYGFGRIGRILARLLIERTTANNKLRLRAIVVRGGRDGDLEKRASLLRRDSIHGPFNGSITVDAEHNAIIANGNYIKVIYANQPEDIDYTEYDIDNALIVDNTGKFKDETALSRHLVPKGASKVLLTAPAGGNIKNIVYGVNQDMIGDEKIVCAASCTTNAITPVLKSINDRYRIVNGHVETVHSYTNDQNLIDNYHSAERRGRSAPLNMVLTSTGAAKAVAKALPELAGKLTGNAIRVPTPNVSMAVMNLNLAETPSRDDLNTHMRDVAYDSPLSEQIAYSASTEVVSTDFVGTPEPAIFDSVATIVQGNSCVLYVWYDNEYGYSVQVVRVMRHMVGMHIPALPV
ncbi:MAG: glyceraldehyde-3-phosphate dehydrogenase [bacterium]